MVFLSIKKGKDFLQPGGSIVWLPVSIFIFEQEGSYLDGSLQYSGKKVLYFLCKLSKNSTG